WAIVKEKVEKDREKNAWDTAIKSLEKFAQEYADAERDSDYVGTLKSVRGLQSEAEKYFKRDMGEAQKHADGGRFGQAFALSEAALVWYPERQSLVRTFQEAVRQAQFEKSMVRIPSTPCWIGNND